MHIINIARFGPRLKKAREDFHCGSKQIKGQNLAYLQIQSDLIQNI